MKASARYVKIVEWSEEDQCYVGSSPGLIYGGCHGDDEKQVFDELCAIVEEAIALDRRDGKPLAPATTSGWIATTCPCGTSRPTLSRSWTRAGTEDQGDGPGGCNAGTASV